MASDERWYFTKEQLANTPSRRSGLDADKELSYRQQAANFIQDMGQRLVVSQLCINTAIVYMHRFYMFHSLNQFPRNSIAIAALFLAAKVEEQPRKLEHVIKMAHLCLFRDQGPPDSRSDQYLEHAQDLVFNENVLLQTLGFDVAIDHPHTHVVRCCQLVKGRENREYKSRENTNLVSKQQYCAKLHNSLLASKELAQTSYFMASNSLHLTTMCLQYKPTVVACFCIHLACKWSNWEIPQSTEGKPWFWYVDRTVTAELLQELTDEFLHIFDKCPSRLKKKIMSISANQSPSIHHASLPNSPFDTEPRKIQSPATDGSGPSTSSGFSSRSHHSSQQEKQDRRIEEEKKALAIAVSSTSASRTAIDYHREYRERKERERLEREKVTTMSSHIDLNKVHHSHHHKPMSNTSVPNKHQVPSSVQKSSTNLHHNHYMKMGPVPQRHSTGSQPREPTNRQRLPREHNVSAGSIAHSSHVNANLDSSLPSESLSHRTDGVQDSTSSMHGRSQEKLSNNNNHSGHRLNVLDSKHQTSHDKRLYRGEDPRLKSAKYPDISKIENSTRRKADERCEEVRQRCEEVRKLIEKPPPKQADVPYLMNTASQKQPAHHSKYNQQQSEKSQSSSLPGDSKHGAMPISQNMLSQDKSPNVSVPHTVLPHKSIKQIYNQPSTVSLTVPKDTIKNGNSQSCLPSLVSTDDSKLEKRSRTTAYEDSVEKNSADVAQQNTILHTPPNKHRSLFSPETPTVKEPHSQSRPRSKQKTPPISATKVISPFVSSPTSQDSLKRTCPSDNVTSIHKRLRTSSNSESEQLKKKIEDASGIEAMKMMGRVSDLITPIPDILLLSSNGKNSNSMTSVINDMKPPELIKPFEEPPRFNTQYKASVMNVNMLTNGMDVNAIKQEAPENRAKKDYQEHYVKKEQSGQKTAEPSHSHFQPKLEYSSPMKSAQSISALLQEPLAPMPSLLQSLQQQHSQVPLQQVHHEQQSIHHSLTDHQLPVATHCLSVAAESDNLTPIASTVDISALSCVPIIQQSRSNEAESTTQGASESSALPTEEKRSEHHKSEKKKKKEKHKHKDKEKSKEKHKHKHKDKDKERHREKKDKEKSDETLAAAPIKITIPKDKLNLSTETSPISGSVTSDKNISPQSTGLKIKIPKERLKGTDSVPSSSLSVPPAPLSVVPLKFKIRTDGIYRSSATAAPTQLSALPASSSSSSLLLPTSLSSSSSLSLPSSSSSMLLSNGPMSASESTNETTSRKRDRVDSIGDNSATVAKKQMMISATGYGQGYRPGERQNGRHYNSGSNNKVRGRGGRQHYGRGPPLHPIAASQYGNVGGPYNYRGGRGGRNYQAPPYRGDGGYARSALGNADQPTEYFCANYSQFNTPAGYMYDPMSRQFYQQVSQQSQYPMYSAGNNVPGMIMITPDGAINTSVPPPSLYQNYQVQSSASVQQQKTQISKPVSPPPLPNGPPPPPPPPPPMTPE